MVSDFVFMGFLCFYYFSCLFCPAYFILFIFIILLLFWMPVCFLIRETNGVDLGGWGSGEDLGGVSGGKDRLYSIKNLFSIKK